MMAVGGGERVSRKTATFPDSGVNEKTLMCTVQLVLISSSIMAVYHISTIQ